MRNRLSTDFNGNGRVSVFLLHIGSNVSERGAAIAKHFREFYLSRRLLTLCTSAVICRIARALREQERRESVVSSARRQRRVDE